MVKPIDNHLKGGQSIEDMKNRAIKTKEQKPITLTNLKSSMKEINQHSHISIKRSVGLSCVSKSFALDEKVDVE